MGYSIEQTIEKYYSYSNWNLGICYHTKKLVSLSEYEQINKLIDKVFKKENINLPLDKIIYYIRTILKNYPELFLRVEVEYPTKHYDICCEFKEINYFKNTIKTQNQEKIVNIKYDKTKGISCTQENLSKLRINEDELNIFSSLVAENIKEIQNLNNIRALELNKQDRVLIEVYELFYGSQPDFSSEEDQDKIKNMCYLLSEYGINLQTHTEEPLNFVFIKKLFSQELNHWLNQLTPIGNNYGNQSEILFNHDISSLKIITISEEVKKLLQDIKEEEQLNALTNLCNTMYLKKYVYPTLNIIEEIRKNHLMDGCSDEEIQNNLSLLKVLDTKIKNARK